MRSIGTRLVCGVFTMLLSGLSLPAPGYADEFKIGLRAYKGIELAIMQWQPTVDFLNEKIPQHHFTLIPYIDNSQLNQALSRGEFDFVFTNSAAYVEHASRYGVRPVATLINKREGLGLSVYGTVIFTRAERDDLNTLADLKGKTFMGADELGFGGWRAAWYEMLQQGIDPYRDFRLLSFGGGQQQRVVAAVLAGQVDAGSVRTDMLERMAKRDALDLGKLKIINSKKSDEFPFLHSTALYPEWPFAVLKHVPEKVVRQVALTLFSINPESPAAMHGKYMGWTLPLNYSGIDDMLKELRVGPYANQFPGLAEFIMHYWVWLMVALALLLTVLATTLYFLRLSRKLNKVQSSLVEEVRSRRSVENILHRLALHTTAGEGEETFLKNCVKDLAAFYKTRYAFVGLFADKRKLHIRTRAVWAGQNYADNFEYELKGTPCEDVLNYNIEIIPRNAAKLYPTDEMLIDMGIDSYYGAPLVTHNGEMLGLVSVMDVKPLEPANWARDVLGVFANRIATELQRLKVERELKGTADELSYLASHDSLTGLINRREFERRLANALEDALHEGKEHAFLYLDLDQFKIVNDTCGHAAGDELLRQLTLELQNQVRGSDTLARLGGDEFGVLLLDCPLDKATVIAENLREHINRFRFNWNGKLFEIGACIGLVIIDQYSGSLKRILNAADSACYIAKENGRNRIHIFQVDDQELARRAGEIQWASRISEALNENRFMLFRQDILPVSGKQSETEQFEILLRYQDDNQEILAPGDLIVAAERYNLMLAVDKWVIENSLAYLAEHYSQECLAQIGSVLCHINISGISIHDENFQAYIENMIRRYQLPAHCICLEITETAAISNLSKASLFIRELKAFGVQFALDDFGSGMSSFTYLKNMPIDYLKIDGHFVRDVTLDVVHRTMLKSIHQIGHVMQIKTIAESVENESVRQILEKIGIDLVQGYAIDIPHPIRQYSLLSTLAQ